MIYVKARKFGSKASNTTIGTGLGGDLSPLERLIRGDMRVDTGFLENAVCARNSPILVGDDFQCDYARGFREVFCSDYLSSLNPFHTHLQEWIAYSHYSIVEFIRITGS